MTQNILHLVFVFTKVMFVRQTVLCDHYDEIYQNLSTNETIWKIYMNGVSRGIINMHKYPLDAFQRDEQNIFRNLYAEYVTLNGSLPLSYEEWLVMNNFGILCDTQESLFQKKISKRSVADNKRRFINTVRKGDILITGRGIFGLVGHAAIMMSDKWVLEMKGGASWYDEVEDNNRRIRKDLWLDERSSYWVHIYRCNDANAARDATVWSGHNYYNPSGGSKKTVHITYKITDNMWSMNPSYCSKLIIQAYYFGTRNKKIVKHLPRTGHIVVPTNIPGYFLSPYSLYNIGKF